MADQTRLSFKDVSSDHVKACFREAYSRFSELHQNPLFLEQLALSGYTMRAQPVPGWQVFRRRRRSYRVQMSDHLEIAQYINPAELPRDVLVGWFAHELGHIVDYHRRPFWSLLWFILGYVLFATHRTGAERRADIFALEKGFGKELMATKLYILEHSKLPDYYKDRIRKYYLSPDELELLLLNAEPERIHF